MYNRVDMENPFKNIAKPPQEVPKEIKGRIFSELARIKLVMDVTELFTFNYSNSLKTFLNKKTNSINN